MASNSLVERGAVCTLRGGSNSHRDYTLVFFPQAVFLRAWPAAVLAASGRAVSFRPTESNTRLVYTT